MRSQSLIETEKLQQAEAEITRLDLALEQRVVERTEKLTAVNEALTQEITERKRVEDALRASEERFRRYFALGLIGMAITSPTKGLLEINDQLCAILGYERHELLRMTWVDLTHPDDLANDVAHFNRVMMGEIDGYSIDKRFIRKDEQVIDATISVKCLRCPDGSVDYFIALMQDITARKQAEAQLKFQANALAQVNDAVITVNNEQRITYWNAGAERLYGYTDSEALGQPLSTITAYRWIKPADEVAAYATLRTTGVWHGESIHRKKNGEEIFVESTVNIFKEDNKPVGTLAVIRDITERKQVEEKLRQSSELSRAFSAKLSSAREEERAHIARELHDELGSVLTRLKWDLEEIHKLSLDPGCTTNAVPLQAKVEDMLRQIDTTVNMVKQLASELRPSILDDLGLVAAIEWQAQQFQTRTGIVCKVSPAVETVNLTWAQATAVFRILQEALTNVLRHAQATSVNILIKTELETFILEIRDNVRGITEMEKMAAQSLGLLGMRERVTLIGGKIKITGVAKQGTLIVVHVPLPNPAELEKLQVNQPFLSAFAAEAMRSSDG
ncbi:MAG: PAS domain S-box protein [Caldilineaceae bacterium]